MQCDFRANHSETAILHLIEQIKSRLVTYQTHFADWLQLQIPTVNAKPGESVFQYPAQSSGNNSEQFLKLNTSIPG